MDDEDLHDRAHTIATAHHTLLSQAFGENIRGLWLTGSTMLRDLTIDSDIDTITLTEQALGAGEEAALTSVHASLTEQFPGMRYDTTYLEVASLARPPEAGLVVPQSLDGTLILDQPGGEIHPVTWFTLPHALRVAGAYPADLQIHADQEAARTHSRDNLRSYWIESVVFGIRAALNERGAEETLEHPSTVGWVVLGAPRLAMFLHPQARHAGPIPSKTEAGRWVIDTHPEYAELAHRALVARHGEPSTFTVGDAMVAADLVETLVARLP